MSAITIENLSKRYRVGAHDASNYRTLREAVGRAVLAPWRRLRELSQLGSGGSGDPDRTHWALRDLSLQIEPGEVVGVIGRNGAGKSTLLKILNRVTEPTSGRVTLRGRVGSLLEVGTGFHQELTGRENIYLNGAILGMSRGEIDRKFDDIVAFADISKYLDTPVKRYSSGMYVRLAFAVASHLETEILLVDEVLAVGDAAFQKRCLGRLGEVGRSGRTVLFVSHNMAAIRNLCQRVACLDQGRLDYFGDCETGIEHYASHCTPSAGGEIDLTDHPGRLGGRRPIFRTLRLINSSGVVTDQILAGEQLTLEIDYGAIPKAEAYEVVVGIDDMYGTRLFTAATYHQDGPIPLQGGDQIRCTIDELSLAPGRYAIMLNSGVPPHKTTDTIEQAAWFEVLGSDYYGNGRAPNPQGGRFLVRSRWSRNDGNESATI